MNWEHEKQFVDNESFVSLRIDEFQILGLLTQRNNWNFDNEMEHQCNYGIMQNFSEIKDQTVVIVPESWSEEEMEQKNQIYHSLQFVLSKRDIMKLSKYLSKVNKSPVWDEIKDKWIDWDFEKIVKQFLSAYRSSMEYKQLILCHGDNDIEEKIEESSDEAKQLKQQQLQKEQELYQVQQQLKQQLQKERELTRQLHEAQQQTRELYQAQEQQVRELYQLQQQQLNK